MSHHPPPVRFVCSLRDLPAHRRFEVSAEYAAGVLAGMPMREPVHDAPGGDAVLEVELYTEGEHVHLSGSMKRPRGRRVQPLRRPRQRPVRRGHPRHLPAPGRARRPARGQGGGERGSATASSSPPSSWTSTRTTARASTSSRSSASSWSWRCPTHRSVARTVAVCARSAGSIRNVETCTCEKPLDPRFEALKGLKLPS